jgi:CDP-glucose 4,6-dehydratase
LPADHLTVKEVVDIAINVWGSGNWEDLSSLDSVHEAKLLKLSIEKAINILGWKPKLDAVTAIEWTIDWYKQPIEKKWEMTNYQIKTYQSI